MKYLSDILFTAPASRLATSATASIDVALDGSQIFGFIKLAYDAKERLINAGLAQLLSEGYYRPRAR